MKSIILIAPPAAGKGTQAKLIASKYKLPHISVGDLIRASLNDDSAVNKLIKEQMQSGKLVDDDIIIKLLKERLNKEDCSNGYILDGFPRNINQAKIYDQMLEEINREIGHVILLEVSKDITKNRIIGRRSCSKCGSVYNVLFEDTKPQKNNLCDKCNLSLIIRDDDNEQAFEKRYQTYLKETEPIVKFYKDKGILNVIDSSVSPDYTFEQIEAVINEVNND